MFDFFDDQFNLYWDKKDCFELNNKKKRTRDIVSYMLDRSQQIFKWEGLPDTIPAHNLETILQTFGNACITEVTDPEQGDAGLYAFFGGLGGIPNAYYEPTIYTIANPYLGFNKMCEIGVDCVRMRNDKYSAGLLPMFVKYGSMLNENEISMNMLAICYRIDNLISADNDRTFESAKEYLDGIIEGQFGVISSTEFFEGIRNDKTTGSNKSIKDLIEYEQYIKASWFNEIGLNSNYNMKRERIVASESEMNDDALIPLVDNMLEWRLKAVEEIKEMYGDRYDLENLNVSLNPIWDLDRQYVGMIPEDTNETLEEVTEMFDEDENDNPDAMTVSEMLDDLESDDPETEVEEISEPEEMENETDSDSETNSPTEHEPEEMENETETDSDSENNSPTEPEPEENAETISERLENIDEKLDEIIEEVNEDEIDETD